MDITDTPLRFRRSLGGRASFVNPDISSVHVSLSPLVVVSPLPPVVNDDDAEIRERLQGRIRVQVNSSSPGTPVENRRQSIKIDELSHGQIAEHYANCMKLSAENKITVKNAFGLHLIDYMSNLYKKKDGNLNFQMASCTLDASAKIYAFRVDCVHADVYKMAGGLGLAEEPKQTDEANENDEQPEDAGKTVRKKRKTKKSATIEANLKVLNINRLEMGFQADSLFMKMSRAFEEGGMNGLLYNITTRNDSSELLLDSSAPYKCENAICEFPPVHAPKDIITILDRIKSDDSTEICPSISRFSFINKDSFIEEENEDAVPAKRSNLAFDIDSVPEPIEIDRDDIDVCVDDNHGGFFDGDDDDVPENQQMASEISLMSSGTTGIAACAAGSTSEVAAISRFESGLELTQALAEEPTEYSYFDHKLLNVWAGPNHWQVIPRSKSSLKGQGLRRKKTKKSDYTVDFEDSTGLTTTWCSVLRPADQLTMNRNLKTWDREKCRLPIDLFYDPKKLRVLFTSEVYVTFNKIQDMEVNSDIGKYDFDNVNDRENFCPDLPSSQDDDEDEMNTSFAGPSRGSSLAGDVQNETGHTFSGSNLVPEPQKVEKLTIGYAKTAKKIDVKKLKQAMWDILIHNDNENKENVDTNDSLFVKMKDPMKFSEVYRDLPRKISSQMTKNLSVPVAFVCFLHMANEKTLHLTKQDDMKDFTIMQG